MTITPYNIYQDHLAAGLLKPDPAQAEAVTALQGLFEALVAEAAYHKQSFFKRLISELHKQAPRGLYIHGGVGRGKTMLMDLFYEALPAAITKRRVHFHEFMIEVHDYIHTRVQDKSAAGLVDQALPSLAAQIAHQSHLLCFDEFHVEDITDAMILGRLFKILFAQGVIVVATSNWAPDDLYQDGLQRARFLPFIDLLTLKMDVLYLDSPHDYRAQTTPIAGTYFMPLGRKTRKILDEVFAALTEGMLPESEILTVKGRDLHVAETAQGVARFGFAQLCERPHGAEDYIAIARAYHTVFLEDIPKLGYDRRNEAKRFMHLIDALYEQRCRVIISAAAPAETLYTGHDHAYAFKRTASRLLEMQSGGYP